jgi:hypothetical protein
VNLEYVVNQKSDRVARQKSRNPVAPDCGLALCATSTEYWVNATSNTEHLSGFFSGLGFGWSMIIYRNRFLVLSKNEKAASRFRDTV